MLVKGAVMPRERLMLGDAKYHQIPEQLTTRQADSLEARVREFLSHHALTDIWSIAYDFDVSRHGGDVAIVLSNDQYLGYINIDHYGHGTTYWYEHHRTPLAGDFYE